MSTPPKHSQPASVTLGPNSDEADSSIDALNAALPAGLTLNDICILLAAGVCEAYAAYNNGSNLAPSLNGYKWFNPIYVWELDPNGNPFSAAETKAQVVAGTVKGHDTLPSRAAAYVSRVGAAPPPCTGPIPSGTPSPGSQLFGFTATANDNSHNILVYRGTVTLEEAGYDLLGWGDNTDCLLPSQWFEQTNYGQVNSYLFAFYVNKGANLSSLASSTMDAIQATMNQTQNNLPWYLGAHSLGGAMISLAALDAVASGAFGSQTLPLVITFGSLHVGDQVFANSYRPKVPLSGRIANLCDFVPSMVSLEPVTLPDPYVHVGTPGTFVWQKWDDWANHSLSGVYQPMVQSHWDIIHWGSRTYPQ